MRGDKAIGYENEGLHGHHVIDTSYKESAVLMMLHTGKAHPHNSNYKQAKQTSEVRKQHTQEVPIAGRAS